MKYMIQLVAAAALTLMMSGCYGASAQSKLNGINGNGCNNKQCKCAKPCQCGSGCKCGMKGNKINMNGE